MPLVRHGTKGAALLKELLLTACILVGVSSCMQACMQEKEGDKEETMHV